MKLVSPQRIQKKKYLNFFKNGGVVFWGADPKSLPINEI